MAIFQRKYLDKRTGLQRKAKNWTGQYLDAFGVRQRVTLSTDKTAARQMLAELERQVELEKAGLMPINPAHASQSLREHAGDFIAHLENTGRTGKHIRSTARHLEELTGVCNFRLPKDVNSVAFMAHIQALRASGLGFRILNQRIQAVKQFMAWMVRESRAISNPLAYVKRFNEAAERRHERRALAPTELKALIEATVAHGEPWRGLTGLDRGMLYLAAYQTGFRVSELASLTPESFSFEGEQPQVCCKAAYAKNRQQANQPLPNAHLRPWIATKIKNKPLWGGTWIERAADMIRRDANLARSLWLERMEPAEANSDFLLDSNEGKLDFHALRHTFITHLERSGVRPKVIQKLARHSCITLTLGRYSHADMRDLGQAVAAIGFGEGESGKGNSLPTLLAPLLAPKPDTNRQFLTQNDTCHKEDEFRGNLSEKPENQGNSADFKGLNLSAPGEIRTPDRRIRNPLLYPAELRGL